MLAFLRRNTIALVALFLALGGTAYAANTVRSADIVDGTIKSVDLSNGAVTPAKTTGVWTYHDVATQRTSDCITRAEFWTACAPLQLTVPAGHRYSVTVQSTSEVWVGNNFKDITGVRYCAARTGPTCFADTFDETVVDWGRMANVSNAGHAVFGPGTYTFSTALFSYYPVPNYANAHTTTTVTATDAASTVH